MKRVKTMVYLDKEDHDALRQISEKTGAPMAFQIRNAVKWFLAKRGKEFLAKRGKLSLVRR